MILVSRLNHSKLYVNATMIETVEETPDTVLTLLTGKKIIVQESASDVLAQIQSYYQSIGLIGSEVPRRLEG